MNVPMGCVGRCSDGRWAGRVLGREGEGKGEVEEEEEEMSVKVEALARQENDAVGERDGA